VRDAANREDIVRRLTRDTGGTIGFLSGEDEGRLTYFAAHRWYGWASGPLLLVDIGGGSLEIAFGSTEDPTQVVSLPLGAGIITRGRLPDHPARRVRTRRSAGMSARFTASRMPDEAETARVVAISTRSTPLHRAGGDLPLALREGLLLRRLSSRATPESLNQLKLIQDTAHPDPGPLTDALHPRWREWKAWM
jgi:exopolyphosphatase/guanosine-5'-triphosphate,3'-diphosphate pyrophosphatase